MNGEPILLLRVTRVGQRERDFAEQLAAASGLEVVYLVDGRKGPVPEEARPIVAISDSGIAQLGIPVTQDYAWRCGDYGLYLARRQFPDAAAFWLIEGDVRFSGADPAEFFAAMKRSQADLLTSYLRPAPADWFWTSHGRARDATPYQCLFCVVRASAALVDALLEKRRQHGRSWWRAALCANDEVFVATTAANATFSIADMNAIDGPWYSTDRFAYHVTIDGDSISREGRAELLHSVRWGEQVGTRVIHPQIRETLRRRVAKKIVRYLRW